MYVQSCHDMLQYIYIKERNEESNMKFTQIERPNEIVRAISDELRKKGIVYDKTLSSIFITVEGCKTFEIMTLDCIIDGEALFAANRPDDENFEVGKYFSLQDVLRIRSLLEEIYEVPVDTLVAIESREELNEFKEALQERVRTSDEIDAFLDEVFK